MPARIIDAASDKHRAQLELLAEVLGLDSVRYEDLDGGENYHLTREGRTVTLHVRSTRDQGGFLHVTDDRA